MRFETDSETPSGTAVRARIDPAEATMMDDSLEGLAYSLAEPRRTAQVLIRTAGITLG